MTDTSSKQWWQAPAVSAPKRELAGAVQHEIDFKTKPRGALGKLEELALKLALIQDDMRPSCTRPTLIVFAADHGLATEGVSAYPQAVTAQMVANFLAGGAAINVFARQHDIELKIVNAGVAHDIPGAKQPLDHALGRGTANALNAAAMTPAEMSQALETGANIAAAVHANGSNTIAFGEMGIGNTSSAALLMHFLTDLSLDACIGRGTGLDDTGFAHKREILKRVIARVANSLPRAPDARALAALREVGGFEIAMMAGAIVGAASLRMVVVVDGYIATAAVLVAQALEAHVRDYCVYSHCSDEHGHAQMLHWLDAHPLLSLDMRLGEGTGAALAIPLLRSATLFLDEMASFASAAVSDKPDA